MAMDKIELATLIGKAAGVNVELTPAQAGYLLKQARRAGRLRLALDKIYIAGSGTEDEAWKTALEALRQDDEEMEEE